MRMKIEMKRSIDAAWELVHEASFRDQGRGRYFIDMPATMISWPTISAAVNGGGEVPVRVNGVEALVASMKQSGIDGISLIVLMPPTFVPHG